MIWASVKRAGSPVVLVCGALTAALALLPVVLLLDDAFRPGGGAPTLAAFRGAYAVDGLGTLAGNSLLFAAGASAVALAIGTVQAVLVVRTDVPLRRLVVAGALTPLFLPGLLYTIAWVLLASPRTGILNGWLGGEVVNVFSLGGMILVEGLHSAPLVFLLVAAALLAHDPAHEEAATVAGARRRTVLWRITLPLTAPALLAAALLSLVGALESFEVPALLGLPGGTPVFTSTIFDALRQFPADMPTAGALSLSLLVLTGAGAVALARLGARGGRFELSARAGARPRRIGLGRWRAPAALTALVISFVGAALPLGALLYASVQTAYAPPSSVQLDRLSATPYARAFEGGSLEALGTSFGLAAIAATAITALMAVSAWLVVRTRVPGRAGLDALASLPLAIPGVVVGVALLSLSTRVSVLYGTLWIVLLAYVVRFMPYGMRSAVAALQRVSADQEDAARVAGASWWSAARRIVLPAVAPGLAAGWLYVLALCVRELSSAIVVIAPGTELVATRIFADYENAEFGDLSALGLVVAVILAAATALAWRLGRRRLV